jgi:hypothetical protein
MCRVFGSSVLTHDAAGITAPAAVALKEAVVVILPARDPDLLECSIKLSCGYLAVGVAGRGSKVGSKRAVVSGYGERRTAIEATGRAASSRILP